MRKLIIVENVSVDGVMEAPEQWAFAYQTEAMAADNRAGMATSDALLLGRVTYEQFAGFWPTQADDAAGIANYINNVAKYVVSTTLEKADWHNTTILRGDLIAEITKLKQQPGQNITVIGSGVLVQSLAQAQLIDEYHLSVVPVILGHGQRLFPTDMAAQKLQLIESKTSATGVVYMRYQPVTG